VIALKVPFLTVLTLCAFAGNSILCRIALSGGGIDPASFTIVRLLSAAFTLLLFYLFYILEITPPPDLSLALFLALFLAGAVGKPLQCYLATRFFSQAPTPI
jgi:drug/metabolite transporter (DMT)-like permease